MHFLTFWENVADAQFEWRDGHGKLRNSLQNMGEPCS